MFTHFIIKLLGQDLFLIQCFNNELITHLIIKSLSKVLSTMRPSRAKYSGCRSFLSLAHLPHTAVTKSASLPSSIHFITDDASTFQTSVKSLWRAPFLSRKIFYMLGQAQGQQMPPYTAWQTYINTHLPTYLRDWYLTLCTHNLQFLYLLCTLGPLQELNEILRQCQEPSLDRCWVFQRKSDEMDPHLIAPAACLSPWEGTCEKQLNA